MDDPEPLLRPSRRPRPPIPEEPALPSKAAMARNLAVAAVAAARDGFRQAPPELVAARLATCRACPHYRPSDRRCSRCGCGTQPKAAIRSSECPDGRWPSPESPQEPLHGHY